MRLTPAERETLILKARGLTDLQVARERDVKLQTVKNTLLAVRQRLRVRTTLAAITAALRAGLIAEEEV